jgi:hypothetical protein
VSTNQTLFTIMAFVLFYVLLISFYNILAQSTIGVNNAQAGISALTLATTYQEFAQQLSFDEATIDSFLTNSELNSLTAPGNLGVDNPPPAGEPTENTLKAFDDIDDLKGYTIVDSTLAGIVGTYKTSFDVNYVNPANVNQISATRTFVKRLDIKIWRINPKSTDTLTSSIVMGYFHFD